MKIAVTADLHLKSRNECPERWNALENIINQMLAEGIKIMIIAGDLFNIENQNYSEFDELCKQNNQIEFYIVPGNHDVSISSKYFTADNIKIFNEPKILPLGEPPLSFFFLPYIPDKSMGEIIAQYKDTLSQRWVLIGHGDYLGGSRRPNSYESGTYMPLCSIDIDYYKPAKVILGHIHQKTELGKVFYAGSPCGMNINETGKRSFLIVDTNNINIISKTVDTDYIFFNETLVASPTENEFDFIRNKIVDIASGWNLSESELSKAKIRLKIKGYTSDKGQLETVIKDSLGIIAFYNNEGPDLTEIAVFDDPERISIVEKVKEEIEKLEWNSGDDRTKKDDILEQALKIVLRE
ncbi:MAG: metallophosphoesterase [Thermodesulfovibrionales bacterium]|nr:metallophosphoesterase [Thermodesulfovibrionales bacterium]